MRVTIMRETKINLTLDLFDNVRRQGEVGFAKIAFDHLEPLIFKGLDLRADAEGVFTAEQADLGRIKTRVRLGFGSIGPCCAFAEGTGWA